MRPPIIFFDIDGTLNYWREWATPADVKKPGFFYSAEPIAPMCAFAAALCAEHYAVAVCSKGYGDTRRKKNEVKEEKARWLWRYVPELTGRLLICPEELDKDSFLRPEPQDILISDRTADELETWSGVGIKVLNGANGRHGRWKGLTLDICADLPEMLGVLHQALSIGRKEAEAGA